MRFKVGPAFFVGAAVVVCFSLWSATFIESFTVGLALTLFFAVIAARLCRRVDGWVERRARGTSK